MKSIIIFAFLFLIAVQLNAKQSQTSHIKRRTKGIGEWFTKFFGWKTSYWTVKGQNSFKPFKFDAQISENENGILLTHDQTSESSDFANFVESVLDFTEVDVDGDSKKVPEIDFRLVKKCNFYKNPTGWNEGVAFGFFVESTEEHNNSYDVEVQYKWGAATWSDVDIDDLVAGLKEACKVRHTILAKEKKEFKNQGDQVWDSEQNLERTNSDLGNASNEVEVQTQEHQKSEENQNSIEGNVQNKQEQLDSLKDKLTKLEEDKNEALSKKTTAKLNLESAESNYEKINKEYHSLQAQVNSYEEALKDLQSNLESAKEKTSQAGFLKKTAQTKHGNLKEKFNNAKQQNQNKFGEFSQKGEQVKQQTKQRSSKKVEQAKTQVKQNLHSVPISQIKNNQVEDDSEFDRRILNKQ